MSNLETRTIEQIRKEGINEAVMERIAAERAVCQGAQTSIIQQIGDKYDSRYW